MQRQNGCLTMAGFGKFLAKSQNLMREKQAKAKPTQEG